MIKSEENISHEFRFKNICEITNYFIKEINQIWLMSKKNKEILNYIEHLIVIITTVTGSVSISAFVFFVVVPIETTSSAIGLKFVQ